MKFIISDEVKLSTTKCTSGLSCLTKVSKEDHCQVESVVAGKIYIIKCFCDYQCAYRYPLGYGLCCNCPTRKEIFSQYGV